MLLLLAGCSATQLGRPGLVEITRAPGGEILQVSVPAHPVGAGRIRLAFERSASALVMRTYVRGQHTSASDATVTFILDGDPIPLEATWARIEAHYDGALDRNRGYRGGQIWTVLTHRVGPGLLRRLLEAEQAAVRAHLGHTVVEESLGPPSAPGVRRGVEALLNAL